MALAPYIATVFVNKQAPALNETTRNKNENGLSAVTATAIELEGRVEILEQPDPFLVLEPQLTPPAHEEGLIYYDSTTKSVTSYNDIQGTAIEFGREQRVRVINKTGTTISNGVAVRQNGVDATTGLPTMILSQADLFSNATIGGVTTNEIANGEEGEVTTFGYVGDVDTSAFAIGDTIFLSDVIAGGFVSVAPDIASKVGLVAIVGVQGKIFVRIEDLVSLPNVYGALSGGNAGATFTADTYQAMTNYAGSSNVAMLVNETAGLIRVPVTGGYRITINLVMNFDTIGNNKEDLYIGIHDGVTIVKEIQDFLGKDSEAGSFYPSFVFEGQENTDYSIQIKSSFALTGVTYSLSEFDIASLHIRR